ncbi:hypothetical protein GXM_07915 [Nostoc sphaeroides CCNUC1]|uniref:Uncharacterized protein n=1 Tax=Nostoc sphaeroides CCNUC1 TaxID=2653204 RepID=A0A5P8WCW5_9NOSO|nr:hypothetical protein GXM_07915 [Nostoc sphaeroides CCNUC1]
MNAASFSQAIKSPGKTSNSSFYNEGRHSLEKIYVLNLVRQQLLATGNR